MSTLAVVVPEGIDDPARVSGGNRYDRRVCDGLRAAGWRVAELAVAGSPELAAALDSLPDGALVLVDGLIGSAAAPVLVPRAGRLRLVVLVHMLFGGDEGAVFAAARAVVTTSDRTRRLLLDRYALPPERVHVARPGTDRVPVSPPGADGGRLLCVGTLSPIKGQDLLLEALAATPGLWRCTFVGPLDREPDFVASLQRQAAGIADRLRWAGVRTEASLAREYREADLLVVPSRTEAYGMVVGEALAAGVPVLATAVGGIPEALGQTAAGVPGLLVPPDDPRGLAAALARWLADAGLRERLRRAALARRDALPGWRTTEQQLRDVLVAVGGEPDPVRTRVPR